MKKEGIMTYDSYVFGKVEVNTSEEANWLLTCDVMRGSGMSMHALADYADRFGRRPQNLKL